MVSRSRPFALFIVFCFYLTHASTRWARITGQLCERDFSLQKSCKILSCSSLALMTTGAFYQKSVKLVITQGKCGLLISEETCAPSCLVCDVKSMRRRVSYDVYKSSIIKTVWPSFPVKCVCVISIMISL